LPSSRRPGSFPFALGGVLAVLLYDAFGTAAIPRLAFILFIGTAMSVTAFPVLARIIAERRLDGTVPGDTALVCAAINDAAAWVLAGSVAGPLVDRWSPGYRSASAEAAP